MSHRTHTARSNDADPDPHPDDSAAAATRDLVTVPHAADLALVRAAVGGGREQREVVVTRLGCVPRMLAAQNRRMGNPLRDDELQDLAQDTLALVWRKLPSYAGLAALETWVYRFCALELRNAARRLHKNLALGEQVRALAPAEDGHAVREDFDVEAIHASLDRLPAAEAIVVRLKHFEQLTFDEIGTRIDISPNTAKTMYYRAIERLREWLGARFREDER